MNLPPYNFLFYLTNNSSDNICFDSFEFLTPFLKKLFRLDCEWPFGKMEPGRLGYVEIPDKKRTAWKLDCIIGCQSPGGWSSLGHSTPRSTVRSSTYKVTLWNLDSLIFTQIPLTKVGNLGSVLKVTLQEVANYEWVQLPIELSQLKIARWTPPTQKDKLQVVRWIA